MYWETRKSLIQVAIIMWHLTRHEPHQNKRKCLWYQMMAKTTVPTTSSTNTKHYLRTSIVCNQIRCGASLTVTLFSTLFSLRSYFFFHSLSHSFRFALAHRVNARVCNFNPSRYRFIHFMMPIKITWWHKIPTAFLWFIASF